MTREQFLIFKDDFKKSVQITKLCRAHKKAYWNDGFKTEEEQFKAIKQKQELCNELTLSMSEGKPLVRASCPEHHWAYYCAKHRLNEEESKKYIEECIKPMKFPHKSVSFSYDYYVKPLLEKYEKIVCTGK